MSGTDTMSGAGMTTESIQGYALSPQQRRVWQLLRAPGAEGVFLGAQAAAWLTAELDAARLEAAVRSVIDRHEILRTTYRLLSGMTLPVQVVEESAEPSLLYRQGDPEAGEAELVDAALRELAARQADPSRPLLHVIVTSMAPDRHLLCLGLPALSTDGASVLRLVHEIGRAYAGEEEEEGEGGVQYADVAQVFNDLLESEETEEGREYWHRFDPAAWSAGRPPFAAPPAGEGPFRPSRLRLPELDADRRAAVLARRAGGSEEAVWLACWAALLARLSGHPDLVLGVSFAGRSYEGLETAQGPFARLLPIECRVEETASFRSLATRIGDSLAEASDRQDYFRWEDLTTGGAVPRFSLVFEQGDPWPAETAGGLAVVERRVCLEPFDLRFACERGAGGELRAELAWDGALFSGRDMETLASCLAALAVSALAAPDREIGALEILGSAAREQLLAESSVTAWPGGPVERCLHELFEDQVDRTPESPALVFEVEGGVLTYAELEERANRLARLLRRLGVGPESRVGVCLERSPSLVIALLATLKAGGAYVPLDPAYPRERLALMIEDAALALLVTAGKVLEETAVGVVGVPLVRLDEEPALAALPAGRLSRAATPDHLAYLIYTSGSTGRPKAVLMPHRGIVNRLLWMQEAFPLSAADAVLQKTPFSFDASIWEIFLPLFVGARVVLARPGGQRDGAYLLRALAENRISVLQLVPSHLSALLQDEESIAGFHGLSRLFCGGEALPLELARRVRALGAEVCNLYGPTEAAIDATFWPVDGETGGAIAPIGRPIANVRVHLADRELRPVPAGIPGELVVAGAGLARGYAGRPELTAERFVPDPFATTSTGPGGRLYRTGDLARRRPDGTIEFLGRIDDQVKIHGFRIEPGEIAAAVARHPGVREAAVVVREGRLVAYVVPAGEWVEPSAVRPFLAELRRALQETLPEHMVPGDLVALETLPRAPNGKLDRAALPAPDASELEAGFLAPRTPVEEMLAGILAEILGRDRISVRAGYLELGGHSLMATQVISRLRAAFQVELPLRSLFELPSLIDLASLIEEEMRAHQGLVAPPLAPVPRDGELPLSFAQQRLWFLHELQPGSPYFNSFIALRAVGRLDRAALRGSVSEIVRRHEVLRTTFTVVDGRPMQHVAPPSPVRFPVLDLTALPAPLREAEALRLAAEEGRRPFDLQRDPLLRISLVELAAEESLILFTMHHITGDGWSTGILARELSVLYDALVRGLPAPLPEPPVQYADFASWQRGWLQGDVLQRQVDWWRAQLAGSPSTLRLATDRQRPAVQTSRGARLTFEWAGELPATLRALARRERATTFMVVMAAFQALLHLRSGQEDLVVGTDVANRNRVETEGLIGFFVNQLPLRARFASGMTFQNLLAQVRETSLGAYGHQDLPFEKMVEVLRPERSSEHAPLFQVKLNLQNVPPVALSLPGLTLSRLEVHKHTAQLDLIVNVEEGEAGLRGSLEYNSDLWNAGTMEGLLEDFRFLLESIAGRPDLPIEEARSLLAEAARQREEIRAQEFADISLQKLKQRARRSAAPIPAV